MKIEITKERSKRILNKLKSKYPGKESFDIDGRGKHFVCIIDSAENHPEYDKAIEVIISSKPHKHKKITQYYKILSGALKLYINNKYVILQTNDTYIIKPNIIHWATSNNECWVEICSRPAWTKKDHILINKSINSK